MPGVEHSETDGGRNLTLHETTEPIAGKLVNAFKRLVAFAIDLLAVRICVVGYWIPAWRPFDELTGTVLVQDTMEFKLWMVVAWVSSTIVLFGLGECIFGFTLGKVILGLEVRSLDGRRPSAWQSLLRTSVFMVIPVLLVCLIPWRFPERVGASYSVVFLFLPNLLLFLPALIRPSISPHGIHELFSGTETHVTQKHRSAKVGAESPNE